MLEGSSALTACGSKTGLGDRLRLVRGPALQGVRVGEKVGGKHLSSVFRVESGLRGCRSRYCRRSLLPSSAWRRQCAGSAAAASSLLSSDGPRGPLTSPWWAGCAHRREAPPGPLTHLLLHLQQPHPQRYQPGGCHSPHLLASLVRVEEASCPPSPVMVIRWTGSGLTERGEKYGFVWLCRRNPMQKQEGDRGRMKTQQKGKKIQHKGQKFK